jgi:gas vesicle protein
VEIMLLLTKAAIVLLTGGTIGFFTGLLTRPQLTVEDIRVLKEVEQFYASMKEAAKKSMIYQHLGR